MSSEGKAQKDVPVCMARQIEPSSALGTMEGSQWYRFWNPFWPVEFVSCAPRRVNTSHLSKSGVTHIRFRVGESYSRRDQCYVRLCERY